MLFEHKSVKFSKFEATLKLSLMSNDENKFLPIFQILHINNVWFLLELALAIVTSIVMKFAPVWKWLMSVVLFDPQDPAFLNTKR